MASPDASQQRGKLISRLSRAQNNKQPRGSASPSRSLSMDDGHGDENTASTSSFRPEHESTQQFDTATQEQLPDLRSSAQRFAYYRAPEPEVHINTSFARDGFPDFSEQSPMSVTDDSLSIELGRGGVKKRSTSRRDSPSRSFNLDDMSEAPILNMGNDSLYDVTSTPPARARPLSSKKADGADRPYHPGSLRKEASVRRASAVRHDTQAPAATATANQRRTLSDMHAKVNAEADSSYVGEDRPTTTTTTTLNPRNTRFSSSRHASAPEKGVPTRFTSGQGLTNSLMETPNRRPATATATLTLTGNQTQQSFMLPDLPNITELVSGVRKDGTPVFARSAKSRSRFTSGTYHTAPPTETVTHAKVHSIAVPDDEKAIFASLQLLKDKVAQLEMERSEAVKRMEEYENEVINLKAQVQMEQKFRRPDSALGSDDDDEQSAREKWRVERGKLQSTVRTLQDRLDKTDRKASVSDIAVKRVTQERDGLVTQLGVAYYNSEELKKENEDLQVVNDEVRRVNETYHAELADLKNENQDLRVKLARIRAQFNDETRQWPGKEAELRKKIEKREASVREMQGLTQALKNAKQPKSQSGRVNETEQEARPRRASPRAHLGQDTRGNIMDQIENEIRKATNEAAHAKIKRNTSGPRSRSTSRPAPASRRASEAQGVAQTLENDASEVESTTDLDFSRQSRTATTNAKQQVHDDDDDSGDVTYLSFLDPNELARLRKALEDERRAARRGSDLPVAAPQEREDTLTKTGAVRRKSSMRDVSAGKDNDGTRDETVNNQPKNVRIQSPHASDAMSFEEPRETTEVSVLSNGNASRRRQRSKSIEEMTSAFILPDITLHGRASGPAVQGVSLGQGIAHDDANCTFCPPQTRNVEDNETPELLAVSERDVDETNATIRPSQAPPVALANVVKQLEDEVAHLKVQLAAHEKAYNAHDPALGRRRRTAMKDKIDVLIREVERRSDQIYSLYDVLEGQKQSQAGQGEKQRTMGEEEMEETLQSLGIDTAELAERAARAAGAGRTGRKRSLPQEVSKSFEVRGGADRLVGDSEDELPWEGLSDGSDFESLDLELPKRRSIVR